MPGFAPFGEKLRPGFFRLADKDHIGQSLEIIGLHGDPRAAENGEDAAPLQLGEDLADPLALHDHARYADDIGALATLEIDFLDVFVDQGDGVFGGVSAASSGNAMTGSIALPSRNGSA